MQLLPFLAVTALITLAPGVDMALVTKNALAHGRRAALATALGVNAGVAIWILASAAGVSALVRASATAFDTLKLAGAVYLVVLGVQLLQRAGTAESASAGPTASGAAACFRQGFFNNLLNPKMGVVFVSLLPQFLGTHTSVLGGTLVLGGAFLVMGVGWLCAYALLAARAAGILRRPRVRAWIEALTGVVLIGLAIRVATEQRQP